MAVKLLNNVRSKLALSVTATETQLRVLTGQGSRFPSLDTAGDWFPVALENESGEIEFCKATARNGDIITVQRGQEGSTARPYNSGDACELRLTVAALMEFGGGGGGTTGPVINVAFIGVEDV